MKKFSRANKGQFSIIAALLVSVILVSAVISTYTMVRHSPIQGSPKVLTAIGEMNADIKRILDFTVGYYGSVLKVTGNSTYARGLTTNYLSSGLLNIARSHPEWNPSFDLDSQNIVTSWFMPESSSIGNISVTYSLAALGIKGVKYETSSALQVTMLESDSGIARVSIIRDYTEPELGLSRENFWFYNYTADSDWQMVNPTSILISSTGVYNLTLPTGIDPDVYSLQVEDDRGIIVSAFYSPASVASTSKIPHFIYAFDWDSTGMLDIYEELSTDKFVIELLQNGTMNWLGQPLEVLPRARPIPPVAIKAFRVNATVSGVNQEVPFQVENWASDYKVPLGIAGNNSIFHNNNMIVFLVNNNIEEITLWWNGNDTATQTHYAYQNIYFTDDVNNPDNALLSNGLINLNVRIDNPYPYTNPQFRVTSTKGASSTTAEFLRVNTETPIFWADTDYVIYNGIVRDIVQQEPEFGGGVAGCPNFYSQVVLTLPAHAPYYTYSVRTVFVDSVQPRTVSDLSVVQLSTIVGSPLTEDGTIGGFPESSASTGLFCDSIPTGWDHHWSQVSSGDLGAGIMFTNDTNQDLYIFDVGGIRGAIDVHSDSIEVNPVEQSLSPIAFTTPLDMSWRGAVVTFNSEPLFTSPEDGYVGLWVMVEHPPVVLIDGYESTSESGNNYVDNNISNVDSSNDKGSHSAFGAQKFGPDAIYDTLTEVTTGGSGSITLIDAESFEDSWPPSGWSETGNWAKENNQHYGAGSYSADFDGYGNGVSGNLETSELDCSDALSISVAFRFYDDDLDPSEFRLEYFDGNGWVSIADLGTGYSEDTWNLYEHEITDSRYFVSDFKLRWVAYDVEDGETAYVDLVTVTKETSQPANNELDLEVQWTNADFAETNEELCIYVISFSGENLLVEVWTGSSWDYLGTLTTGWNNMTVSSYLTSPEFTIRFVGETETGDLTQDYWAIDATLLRCWS